MANVPRIDQLGFGLERAPDEQPVVDGAAGDAHRRHFGDGVEILVGIERDGGQPLPEISDKCKRAVGGGAMRRRQARQCGVDFRQGVRRTKRARMSEKCGEACFVMDMLLVKERHEDGRIEKRLHDFPSHLASRSLRIAWTTEFTIATVSGAPVSRTNIPCFL